MSVRVPVQFLDHHARTILVLLTLLFLGIETIYSLNRRLSIDEFNGAYSIHQFDRYSPYFDFQPYKPVLGYAIQLPLLRLGSDTWNGLVAVRLGMAFTTGVVLFLGALWLERVYRPGAVCLAFALMVVMTSMVEWAFEVRLDMLTALFGFISLLLLLNRRAALAGIVAGLGFLISQKGVMYDLAGAAALLGCLAVHRDRGWGRDLLQYGVCVVLPIGIYVFGWSLFAPLSRVLGSTFAEPTQLRTIVTPMHSSLSLYRIFWMETLAGNPFYYLCSLWALGSLLLLGRARPPRETLILFYGGTVAAIMIGIRAPTLYSFLLLAPTLFVLQADLFTREWDRLRSSRRPTLFWIAYCLLGLALPLSNLPVMAEEDPGNQRQSLALAKAILGPGDRYFAGFHLLPRDDANVHCLSVVDPNGARPTMDLTPAQVSDILNQLQDEPIRLLIYTYKIQADEMDEANHLRSEAAFKDAGGTEAAKMQKNQDPRDVGRAEVPYSIRKYLYRHYAPLWSNVWVYAPQVHPSDAHFDLRFTDAYSIEPERPCLVQVDGQTYAPRTNVRLQRGRHSVVSTSRLRLRLQTEKANNLLDAAYRAPTRFFWPEKGLAGSQARNGIWVDD